eukprot:12383351-Alexandrium_andersonii.AAC.1
MSYTVVPRRVCVCCFPRRVCKRVHCLERPRASNIQTSWQAEAATGSCSTKRRRGEQLMGSRRQQTTRGGVLKYLANSHKHAHGCKNCFPNSGAKGML